ncbi:DUF4890 domain-containing protein [Flavobacteriaceae bacterium GSB9]|nr:DUF4890 domain-containing protein [Flavobacteriaceae bacterium GSB9]
MKKLIIIAIAFVLAQGTAFAQQAPKPGGKDKMHLMHTLTPEESATLKTKRMTLNLDLNKVQQDQIYKINLENATKRKEMQETWKARKENGTSERPTKEKRLKMMNARLDHQIAMKAKMKKILNEEQYAKWEKSLAKRSMKKKQKKMAMKKKVYKK